MAQAINWKQLREQYESTEEYRTQVLSIQSYFQESLRKCRRFFILAVCAEIDRLRSSKLVDKYDVISTDTSGYINCVLFLSQLNPIYYTEFPDLGSGAEPGV